MRFSTASSNSTARPLEPLLLNALTVIDDLSAAETAAPASPGPLRPSPRGTAYLGPSPAMEAPTCPRPLTDPGTASVVYIHARRKGSVRGVHRCLGPCRPDARNVHECGTPYPPRSVECPTHRPRPRVAPRRGLLVAVLALLRPQPPASRTRGRTVATARTSPIRTSGRTTGSPTWR